jgi:hypothetical protein
VSDKHQITWRKVYVGCACGWSWPTEKGRDRTSGTDMFLEHLACVSPAVHSLGVSANELGQQFGQAMIRNLRHNVSEQKLRPVAAPGREKEGQDGMD